MNPRFNKSNYTVITDKTGRTIETSLINNSCEFCHKTLKAGEWVYWCEASKKPRCSACHLKKFKKCRFINVSEGNPLYYEHVDWFAPLRIKEEK